MGWRNRKNATARVLLLLSLAFVTTWVLCPPAAGTTMVSVAGEKVNLRKGPSTQYPVIWELGKGFPLRVIGSQGNWIKVSDFESDVGWIYKNLVSRKPHLIVKTNRNSKARINIRSGPGTRYEVVGKAQYGVVFETLKRGEGWVQVRHESGLTGWVKRSLLWGW
ncbi:MAG: SH3 domain-containing protein [Deltaproteobacteria bacterium]|jgi:SH3-like domain-containing protein|nr:SH3 domain-containing protein [Deltaproteobacteria bacterium]